MTRSAIVVGAGLAGLTAAYRLQQAGWKVRVLEQAARLCGRVVTFEKSGYIIDGCATSISSSYVRYLELLREVGLADRLTEGSNVFGMVRHGRVHYVDALQPVRSFLRTRLMSAGEKTRFVLGALRLRKYLAGVSLGDPGPGVAVDALSIEALVHRCFGDALTDTIMDPIMRVVTFGDVRSTTAVEFLTGLVSASGRYLNVRGGLETLPRRLAEHVEVRLGAAARRVEKRGAKVEVSFEATGAATTETVDACVITSTFPEAVALCPQLGEAGPALAANRAHASSYVVHLGYRRPTLSNPSAIALPRREFPNNPAIFLDHNKAPDRAPSGHSLFTLYYSPEAVPLVRSWSETQTVEDAQGIIERYFPEVRGHLDMSNVRFAPYGSHLAPPGHFQARDAFFANHGVAEPIQVAGDYFSLPSQETAVVWGERAAQNLLAQRR